MPVNYGGGAGYKTGGTSTGGGPGGPVAAVDVSYDNSTSGLASTNVQAAIDELAAQSVLPLGPFIIPSGNQLVVDTDIPLSATTYEWTVAVYDNVTGAFKASKVLGIYDGTNVTHAVYQNVKAGVIQRTINVNLNAGTVELEVVNTGPNDVTVVVGRFPFLSI